MKSTQLCKLVNILLWVPTFSNNLADVIDLSTASCFISYRSYRNHGVYKI